MVQRLFRPASTQVWIGLGFTAWLAHLGERGLQVDISGDFHRLWAHADRWPTFWGNYSTWIMAGLALILTLFVLVSLVLLWLRCRGTFMFLDNVIREDQAVVQPWRRSAAPGWRLFTWNLVLWLILTVLLALALAPLLVYGLTHLRGAEVLGLPTALGVSVPLCIVWIFVVIGITVTVADLATPLMYRDQLTVISALRRLLALWAVAPQAMAGYLGVRLLLGITAGLTVFAGGCLTCCCLWFLLMVPLLWAVILLPVLLLVRLYSLEFLRQFGPDFDPWSAATPPVMPPDAPRPDDQGNNPATT